MTTTADIFRSPGLYMYCDQKYVYMCGTSSSVLTYKTVALLIEIDQLH